MQSLDETALRGSRHGRDLALMVGGGGVAAAAAFAYLIMVARIAGPRVYADLTAILSIAHLLGTSASPAFSAVSHLTARYAARNDTRDGVKEVVWLFVRGILKLGLPIAAAGILLSPFLGRWLRLASPAAVALAFVIFVEYLLFSVGLAALQGEQRFLRYNVTLAGEALLRVLGGTVAALAGGSTPAILSAYVLSHAIVLSTLHRRPPSGRPAGALVADALAFLKPVIVATILFAVGQNLDVVVAKHRFAVTDAGIYACAAFLAKTIAAVAVPFQTFMLSRLTTAIERGEDLHLAMRHIMGSFCVIGAGSVTVLSLFGEPLVRLLYGAPFLQAASLLLPLSVAVFASAFSYLVVQARCAIRDFRFLIPYGLLTMAQVAAMFAFGFESHRLAWIVCFAQITIAGALLLESRGRFRLAIQPVVV